MTVGPPRSVGVPVTRRLSEDFHVRAALPCPDCGGDTTLHQPDVEMPHLLLATCGSCRAWTVVSIRPDGREAVLIAVPDPAAPPAVG